MPTPRTRAHGRLLGAFAIDALGSGLFLPFSLLYFTATTALPIQQVGLALSIAAVVRLPATGMAGMLTDRVGPKVAVIASNVAQALGFTVYLLVNSFPQLLAAAIVVQVGNSFFWVSYPALVHRVAVDESQERWFAIINALRSAGLAVGALGAGLAVALGGTSGYRSIVVLNAVSFVAAATLTWLDPIPHNREPVSNLTPGATTADIGVARWSTVLRDRPFLAFVAINVGLALLSLSFVIAVPVFAVREINLPEWIPGGLLAVNATLGALAAAPVVAALTGKRRDRALVTSQLVISMGYACILLAAYTEPRVALALVFTAALLVTTGELIQGPAVSAIVNESASDHDRGRYVSVYQLTFSIVDIIAPIALTAALASGPLATWPPLIIIAAIDVIALLALAPRLPALRRRIGLTVASYSTRATEADGL